METHDEQRSNQAAGDCEVASPNIHNKVAWPKSAWLAMALVLAGAGGLVAGVFWQHTPSMADGRTLVAPDDPVDLGHARQGSTISGNIPLTNRGMNAVNIVSAYGECGCTQVHLSTMLIGARKTVPLGVDFNSTGYHGDVVKSVYVVPEDQSTPMVEAKFHVYVDFDVTLDRHDLDLGSCAFQNPGVISTVNVLTTRPPALLGQIQILDHAGIKVKIGDWIQAGGSYSCPIDLSADGSDPPGAYNREINLVAGGVKLPIAVHFQVQPRLLADPAILLLRLDKPAPEAIIHGPAVENLSITSRDGKVDGSIAPTDRGDMQLYVHAIRAALNAREDYDVLIIKYDLKGTARSELLQIPVRIVP